MPKKSQAKFIVYFISIFLICFVLLYLLGLVPQNLKTDEGESFRTLWDKRSALTDNGNTNTNTNPLNPAVAGESPLRIVIPKIGVDATVANPQSTDVKTLDDYLTKGAVRYPGSGLLGSGNMFLFGHSTGLRNVQNQAYKTFNGLKDLQAGDIITVYSSNQAYTYKVTTVTLVDENQALVKFDDQKNMLTLSTCNTFGAKSERYVVEAIYLP